MYFIYDTKTNVNRGFADTKEEAELLLKELSHKWYYRYLVIRQKGNNMKTFTFSVPASLIYKIEAETELKALKLLVEEGGLSILADDTILDKSNYEMAELIDES